MELRLLLELAVGAMVVVVIMAYKYEPRTIYVPLERVVEVPSVSDAECMVWWHKTPIPRRKPNG